MGRPDLDETGRVLKELRLSCAKDLLNATFPDVPADGSRIRFPADRNTDRRLHLLCRSSALTTPLRPQIKKLSPSKNAFLDEILEGGLTSDPLIRAEPFFWLQRLDLGQLFPAFFTAAREDFTSSGCPRTGKKAVLVTTFSFGRLVCSFHEAGIIVKFVWNIQSFVSWRSLFLEILFFLERSWTKTFFVVELLVVRSVFASCWKRTFILLFLSLWKTCSKHLYLFSTILFYQNTILFFAIFFLLITCL